MTTHLSRRDFLALSVAGLGGLTAGRGLLGRYNNAWAFEVSQTEIPCPSLPEQFDSYRIGFLSDIHFGLWLPEAMVQDAVRALLEAAPDLILLGGDFILVENYTPRSLIPSSRGLTWRGIPLSQIPEHILATLAPMLSPLHAPDGVFAVPGNHDRWYLHEMQLRGLEKTGLRFLINESVTFSRGADTLRLTGTDDFWTGIPKLSLPDRKESREFRILLSHNPDYISQILETSGYEFDLGLCGHTHGGQIILPLLGGLHYNVRDRRLSSGLYSHPRAQIYTSRGLGTVEIPLRLNCPPEVSIVTLKKTPDRQNSL